MLMPASVFKDEIEQEFRKMSYSEKLLWFDGCIDNYHHEIKEEDEKFAFAIVNKYESLIGYISFRIHWYDSCAYNFGLICFDTIHAKEHTVKYMTSGILDVIRMIESFNLHRIDFRCVGDNPAAKRYIRLIDKFQKTYYRNAVTLTDTLKDREGKYHDTIIFELIRK
jgi:RimJ/RimL family protein N-acetyltransferase